MTKEAEEYIYPEKYRGVGHDWEVCKQNYGKYNKFWSYKCNNCGYYLTLKKSNGRYFVCKNDPNMEHKLNTSLLFDLSILNTLSCNEIIIKNVIE